MPPSHRSTPTGRGAGVNVPNRFESVQLEVDAVSADEPVRLPTTFLPDRSRSIVTENKSPDIPFRFSLNPYRGCEHGCAYCYARPTHEYLGMSAGFDFESIIMVKEDAVQLLREWLARPRVEVDPLALSGVTDPYQPAERRYELTRRLLELLLECRYPVSLITKNALIERDIDLLAAMARNQLVHAAVSITTLDAALARELEPRTSAPQARLRAVKTLTDAGVPVRVMIAPVIPGLNDHEIPQLLEAAADAGAVTASYVLLRLPGAVEEIFTDWLARLRPGAHERVLGRIRQVRGGATSNSEFFARMRGSGVYSDNIAATFRTFARKLGIDREPAPQRTDLFEPPSIDGQMRLL